MVEVEPAPAAPAAPAPVEVAAPIPELAEPVVDQDLFTGEFESVEAVMEPEPAVEAEPAVTDPMTDSKFADELFSVLENAFPGPSGEPVADEAGSTPSGGAQIVVSPLFKDFSVEELVAVIAGLKLLTFDRGKVILREGEPGNSLYMLTSGKVKAFVKKDGKQVPIAELEEGAFFGEMSILTGKPRTATIVATEASELLELDRTTLDSITQTHPHVWDVLQEFANQRMAKKS
jgi:cAMP-dependent protein kinase regulator